MVLNEVQVFKTIPSERIVEVKPQKEKKKYHRSLYLRQAKEELTKPYGIFHYERFLRDFYPNALFYIEQYVDDRKEKYVYLRNKVDGRIVKGHSWNRFSAGYRRKINNQVKSIIERLRYNPIICANTIFITLTPDPKRFADEPTVDRVESRCFTRIIAYLRRRAKFRDCMCQYIKGKELQSQTGMPHLHITLFGFSWLMKEELAMIKKLWSPCSNEPAGVQYDKIKNGEVNRVIVEVVKYAVKVETEYQINNETSLPTDLVIKASLGIRSFSMSAQLKKMLYDTGLGKQEPNNSSIWEFFYAPNGQSNWERWLEPDFISAREVDYG